MVPVTASADKKSRLRQRKRRRGRGREGVSRVLGGGSRGGQKETKERGGSGGGELSPRG